MERLHRAEPALAALVTTLVAMLILLVGPAPGDAPAHLYRTFLVRHGALVWDNLWYAGHYPLASYSVLYYLPAAVVGNLPLVLAAAAASTLLFGAIAYREWGGAALWPTRAFGVLAAAPVFTGLYAYSVGFTTMLGALRAMQARRVRLAILLAGLTVGFSPLAFAFLCLVLASLAVARRRVTRRTALVAIALLAIAGIEAGVLVAFASPGTYPFHLVDLVSVLVVCATGALLARRARSGDAIAAFFVLWGIGSVVAFAVPTALGDNWTRLRAFVFPLMLLTAILAGLRPRRLVALALGLALAYNVAPYLRLIPYRLDGRPAHAGFWQPTLAFLRRHSTPAFRVEVVPTAAHWESYWLPRAGFALARGWYRQLDRVDNPPLYKKHLGGAGYRRWLRSLAVEYVVLPATRLDPDGGPAEARLVRSRAAGLRLAYRTGAVSIYRLPHPTPLLTGPGRATVLRFGHVEIAARVSAPGRYLLREHYSPYWNVRGAACVRRGPRKMTWLDVRASGKISLTVTTSADALIGAAAAHRAGSCSR